MIYSKERRAEVLRECDAGKGTREVAASFGVSESWVRRVKQERRELGKVAPKLTRDRKPSWGAARGLAAGAGRGDARRHPAGADRCGRRPRVVGRQVDPRPSPDGLGADAKKKTFLPAEQARPDVADARRDWLAFLKTIDPDRVVCLDETWAKTNMARLYGRCPPRHAAHLPHAARAVGDDHVPVGDADDRAPRPAVHRGGSERGNLSGVGRATPRSGAEAGRRGGHGQPVGPQGEGGAEAIEAAGAAAAYLPAYSPDLNPIELMFNKFKAVLRTGAARTTEALWKLCGTACDAVTQADCRAFFSHCGYRYG